MSYEKIEFQPYDTLTAEQLNHMQDGILNGLNVELLWENASPDSEFAAQTLVVHGVGNSELYQYLAIETNKNVQWFANKVAVSDSDHYKIIYLSVADSGVYFDSRKITISAINELIVDNNDQVYGRDSTHNKYPANNANNIPIKIYGIKGVQA